MSVPDIPLDNINIDLDLGGSLELNVGLDTIANALTTGIKAGVDVGLNDIRLRELPPVRLQAAVTELAPVQVQAAITELPVVRTDSKVDLGLDVRVRELPPVRLELTFSSKPMRVHLPLNYSFCIQLFGIRLFSFSIQGEGMVVTEEYVARATERC